MARPGLMQHRKFRRLARAIGSTALARGILEMMWDPCYEAGDDYLGTAEDIESLVGWNGAPNELVRALVDAGAPDHCGFIEQLEGDGEPRYRVHDLSHHAPDYTWNRKARETERRTQKRCAQCHGPYNSSDQRSVYCSTTCRSAAYRGKHTANAHATDFATDANAVQRSVTEAATQRNGDANAANGPSQHSQHRSPNTEHPTPAPLRESAHADEDEPVSLAEPTWRKQERPQASIVNGADVRRHGLHAWCADREGLCVPLSLHQQFIGRLGRPTAEADLMAFYPRTLKLFAGRSVGENVFRFWENNFALWAGSATSQPSGTSKGNASVTAMARVLEQRRERQ